MVCLLCSKVDPACREILSLKRRILVILKLHRFDSITIQMKCCLELILKTAGGSIECSNEDSQRKILLDLYTFYR